MYQHSIRMENIIADLLLLSRLESEEQTEEQMTVVNINELLKNLCQEAESISGAKQHQISLNADAALYIKGSENELKSLFSNLIINAIKYTPAKGCISIQWCKEGAQAVFKVSDTGIGIAEKDIPRITERFYRVDKARSRESGGTGLGLAIVKHVLMRHQAQLKIESKEGEGSTFSCYFSVEGK
jgi:two-component system phosphate regulon sensor histidine kinase PhoR